MKYIFKQCVADIFKKNVNKYCFVFLSILFHFTLLNTVVAKCEYSMSAHNLN